jgi:small-conductance mechanosensitive channel
MNRIAWTAACHIVVILLGLAISRTPAFAAGTPSAPANGVPAGMSAAQAHDLVTLLNDPVRRQQLIANLQALEQMLPATSVTPPGTPPTATPAPSATPATSKPEPAHVVVSRGLLVQLVKTMPTWADGLLGQLVSLREAMSGVPAAWDWLARTAANETSRWYLLQVAFRLGLILALAGLAWLALRRLLSPRRARVGALAARDPLATTHAETTETTSDRPPDRNHENRNHIRHRTPHLSQRWRGSARQVSLAVLAFVLDVLPVAAFALVGYLLAPVLTLVSALDANDAGTSQAVALAVINAFVVFATVLCVARALVAPDIRALRLVPIADASSVAAVRWVGWLAGIAVFGMALLDIAMQLGLQPAAALALQKLVLLVDHVLLAVIVLRNRYVVAARLRAPKRLRGPFASVLTGLAEVWHIIAVFLILALWLIWAAGWEGGYTHLLEFVATAVAIGVTMRLLTEGLFIALRHALHVTDSNGNGDQQPVAAMPHRAARYYKLLHASISALAAVIGVVLLLQLTGVGSVDWLFDSALGRQTISALVSIAITLCIAVVAWEAANIVVDRHLDLLSQQAQVARAVRIRTLLPILRAVLGGIIVTLVALTVLSQIGVNIAPLLAGAGIVGVAIGFGSQKLVQDVITGIFLLLENAMQVGDAVTLAGVSGNVETLSIRTIRLRAGDGSLHIIPFSSVTMVNNTNRGLGNAAVSVTVAIREDTDAVGEVLKTIVAEMREDSAFKGNILSDLQLWGVDKVDGVAALLVGQIVCTAEGRWGVQREFNRRYKIRFQELGIEIPTPTQTLLLRRAESPKPPPDVPPSASDETAATVRDSPPPSSLGHTE